MGNRVKKRFEDIEKLKYTGKAIGIVVDIDEIDGKIQVYIPSMHGKYDESRQGSRGNDTYPWAEVSIEDLASRGGGRNTKDHIIPDTNTDEGGTTAQTTTVIGRLLRPIDAFSSAWLKGKGGVPPYDVVWLSFQNGDVSHPVYEDCIGTIDNLDADVPEAKQQSFKDKSGNTISLTISVGGWTVPGSNISVSSSNKYKGNESLENIANEVIYEESEYDYIDNKVSEYNSLESSVCTSKLEVEGNGTRDLIKLIESSNPSIIEEAETTYGISLNLDKDWSHITVAEDTALYNALKYILETDESKNLQDSIICSKMSEYINIAMRRGINDPKTLVYFCDLANSNYDEALQILNKTRKQATFNGDLDNTLAIMNNITVSGGYLLGSYINDNNEKRRKTYNKILELDSIGTFIIEVDTRYKKRPLEILYPVNYRYRITTDFGYYIRERPMKNYEYIFHNSVDITGEDLFDKSVLAGFDSTVEVGENDDYGIYVEISNEKYMARYSHLSGLSSVQTGDVIKMGTVIGYVGYSGDTSGICLNLALFSKEDGVYIDPKPYFIVNTIGAV